MPAPIRRGVKFLLQDLAARFCHIGSYLDPHDDPWLRGGGGLTN